MPSVPNLMGLGMPADLAVEVSKGSLTLTDGTHSVANTTQVTVTGGTVGGTSPNATLSISGGGGSASPLPFFGNQTNTPWVRPAGTTFSTWLNQTDTGNTATLTDNAGGLPLVLQAGFDTGGNNCLTGAFKTIGAPPWTITVALAAFSAGNSPYFAPIILYDTGGNKAEAIEWWTNSGLSQPNVQVNQYGPGFVPGTNFPTPVGTTKAFPFSDYIAWFRVHNDNINLTYSIGPDGLLFKTIYTEAVGAFLGTISKVGFGMDRAQTANGPGASTDISSSILWSWVES